MPTLSITKRLKSFAYAHKLPASYCGDCRFFHGHNGEIEVTLGTKPAARRFDEKDVTDRHGLLVDFGDVARLFNNWVQSNFDHAAILGAADDANDFQDARRRFKLREPWRTSSAECIVSHLFQTFSSILADSPYADCAVLLRVQFWETSSSSATITASEQDAVVN